MKKYYGLFILILGLVSVIFGGCSTVQPYEKMYINDADMILANHKLESFEINFETYREGASGANGGKVGGGCGCN